MQRIAVPPLERRLGKRYMKLVESHMQNAPKLAAGVASLPSTTSAMAATQAAWRFFNNDRVTLSALIEPLREAGRATANVSQAGFVLLAHDWCKLSFDHSLSKKDLVQLTHEHDIGYELTTALLVSAEDGRPLAPMEMHLKTATGVLSTRVRAPRRVSHLEQVLPTMRASRTWGLTKPIVHVIDREADSVDHYRRWHAAGEMFLIRGNNRRVKWQEKSCLLKEICVELQEQSEFHHAGVATYRGSPTQLWVAETEVVLHRPAKKNVKDKRYNRPGKALPVRFILAQVRDDDGHVLAQWMLLTNVPSELATADHLAHCYYWRWQIENYFKLLKSGGQQLEEWQQETGPAIARRLLTAAMACVVVWQLQADNSPDAVELKKVLVRLSGRQMKYGRPSTAPALLAGLWSLLSVLGLLDHYDLNDLKRLTTKIPYLNSA